MTLAQQVADGSPLETEKRSVFSGGGLLVAKLCRDSELCEQIDDRLVDDLVQFGGSRRPAVGDGDAETVGPFAVMDDGTAS
jgi:hypothetical protein